MGAAEVGGTRAGKLEGLLQGTQGQDHQERASAYTLGEDKGSNACPRARFWGDVRMLLTEYTWEAGRMSYSVGSGGWACILQLLVLLSTS